MKVFMARLNHGRTNIICGVCEKPFAEWVERDENLPGIRDTKIRQARFIEGMGYDNDESVWRMSNRAKNRQDAGDPVRRYAVDRMPESHVDTFDVRGSAELVAWLSSNGIPMPGSSHADEDHTHIRQQANLPFEVDCPSCGRRNRVDL